MAACLQLREGAADLPKASFEAGLAIAAEFGLQCRRQRFGGSIAARNTRAIEKFMAQGLEAGHTSVARQRRFDGRRPLLVNRCALTEQAGDLQNGVLQRRVAPQRQARIDLAILTN